MGKMLQLSITGVKRKPDVAEDLYLLAARHLRLPRKALAGVKIKRKAIDARNKQRVCFVYTLEVQIDASKTRDVKAILKVPGVAAIPHEEDWLENLPLPQVKKPHPVVIGNGPAGIFAAALLAAQGCSPVVVERGKSVADRVTDVEKFWKGGKLNLASNVQFGEGGAGTFSDGKLTTRINDRRIDYVLATLADAGAGKDIVYLQKPHVGTDRLRNVLTKIRSKLAAAGVHFEYQAKFEDLVVEDGEIKNISFNQETLDARHGVVLAVGNSARDTFKLLQSKGIAMQAKPFAIGFRIEHQRQMIDQAQYGDFAGNRELGAASYNFACQDQNGRGIYTFCMCPGGQVIAAASEEGGVVTNGMSLYSRRMENSNSAIVLTVGPQDFGPGDLAGMEYQQRLEQAAFKLGGGNFFAPVQLLGDYLAERPSKGPGSIMPSYTPGVAWTDLGGLLPEDLNTALRFGIIEFSKKLKGFALEDAVLTAIETRTSCPLRIIRDDAGRSTGLRNLFPAGEGAGYAGGIISSAVDGLRAAESLLRTLT